MTSFHTTRRRVLGGAAGISALGLGLRPHTAPAAVSLTLPSSPVALNVIDVAGQLQLTQGAMEAYAKANPKLVSKITFSQAPAPGTARQDQSAAGRRSASISTWC